MFHGSTQPSTLPPFKVSRGEPELIVPAQPTPHEFKPLSDIDDQEGLRVQLPLIQFYRGDSSVQGKDPVKVIREALAKTLVFYYPFAGRIREGPNRKLIVECTGDGVLFIEADADVTLKQYGDSLQPPFPCFEELLFDVPGSSGIINCPLLLVQVTRLRCGGFILAFRYNHTMSDAGGIFQFISAVSELACGACAPTILPVWERHILNARKPPRVTCAHHEYDELDDHANYKIPLPNMTHRSFFFGQTMVSAIRRLVPFHLRSCTTFEILTAFLWRCRTMALQPNPDEEMRLICIVNARNRFNPPLPIGYYGNCIAYSVAMATAGELSQNPLGLGYALELVRKAKANVTEEYMRSVADLMVIRGRPRFTMVRSYLVSDATRSKFGEVDYGWGKPVYGGPAKGNVASFQIASRSRNGETGIFVTLCVPTPAMGRFVKEVDIMLKDQIKAAL